jgi:GntR family transcriptional repressor for pyruvate dehydrogenase complex
MAHDRSSGTLTKDRDRKYKNSVVIPTNGAINFMAKIIPVVQSTSTADRVANILRDHIVAVPAGQYLGSEGDLAKEIGVSLPTLRQSARMLEHEQLLTIKPGKGGGYFTRRPSIDTAIRAASQFLSSLDLRDKNIKNFRFMDCADPLVTAIIGQAVECNDDQLCTELSDFVQEQRQLPQAHYATEESFKVSATLMTLLGRMSGNTLMELFIRILWNEVSVSSTNATYEETRDIMETNHTTRLRVAEAVLDKDRERAIAAWNTRSEFLRSWPQRGFHLHRSANSSR